MEAGGVAKLQGCQLNGSKTLQGIRATGKGSLVVAKDCKMVGNKINPMAETDGGRVVLTAAP